MATHTELPNLAGSAADESTPEPWEVQDFDDGGRAVIANDAPVGRKLVGYCDGPGCEANANLFAAAPETKRERDELLAAAKHGLSALGAHGPCINNSCRDCDRAFNALHNAIERCKR